MPLLIASGTADDNAHMSNTMEYVARLQADDRWADMLLFPQHESFYKRLQHPGCGLRPYAQLLQHSSKIGNMNKSHRAYWSINGAYSTSGGIGLSGSDFARFRCSSPFPFPQIWLPFVGFALYMILHRIIDKNHYNASNPGCSMILTICARTLFWSSIVMVIINSLHTSWLEPMLLNPAKFNHNIRFLAVYISAPVTFIITLMLKITGRNNEQCRICQFKQGTECNRGFLGHLFAMEANRQINAMLSLSALLTALTYAYYFTFYINTNINTPDELVFIWIPGILYIMSVILFGMRYLGIYQYYRRSGTSGGYSCRLHPAAHYDPV